MVESASNQSRIYRPLQKTQASPRGNGMNQPQTIELFNLGLVEWNRWAQDLMDKRKELKRRGVWTEGDSSEWNDMTREWNENSKADFSGHEFDNDVNFSKFVFPGVTKFRRTRFRKSALFHYAQFLGNADFSGVEFSNISNFSSAEFHGKASFVDTHFRANSKFCGALFSQHVTFESAKFDGRLYFEKICAQQKVSFERATLSDISVFHVAKFCGETSFRFALISQTISFKDVEFQDHVFFDNCILENVASFVRGLYT